MKKTIILAIVLITLYSCSNQNVNPNDNPQLTPKEALMGKWYFTDPNLWYYEFTPTEMIRNIGNTRFKIIGLTDSTIYFEKLGSYPPYTIQPYKINGDTLRMGGTGYFLRFKN